MQINLQGIFGTTPCNKTNELLIKDLSVSSLRRDESSIRGEIENRQTDRQRITYTHFMFMLGKQVPQIPAEMLVCLKFCCGLFLIFIERSVIDLGPQQKDCTASHTF
jgi:hypothetical protein